MTTPKEMCYLCPNSNEKYFICCPLTDKLCNIASETWCAEHGSTFDVDKCGVRGAPPCSCCACIPALITLPFELPFCIPRCIYHYTCSGKSCKVCVKQKKIKHIEEIITDQPEIIPF